MAKLSFYNNVGETTNTTGTGTLTLTNTAVTQAQVFPAAADGQEFVFFIRHSDNSAWEVSRGTYTNTGRTLTRTLISSSTGSLLSLTGTGHEVSLVLDALRMAHSYQLSKAYIEGLELDYNAGTIKLLRGYAIVNDELLEIGSAGTTTVSGDALTGFTGIMYYYIYDNAGTVQMHREQRVSGSDDPVWDYDLDYAKHPVDGAAKRCIGALYVGSTTAGVIDDFVFSSLGRHRVYIGDQRIARVVNGGSATTATSINCDTSIPAISITKRVGFKLHTRNDTGGTSVIRISWAQHSTACTNYGGLQVSAEMDTGSQSAALGPLMYPATDTTFYYLVSAATASGFVDINLWEIFV